MVSQDSKMSNVRHKSHVSYHYFDTFLQVPDFTHAPPNSGWKLKPGLDANYLELKIVDSNWTPLPTYFGVACVVINQSDGI